MHISDPQADLFHRPGYVQCNAVGSLAPSIARSSGQEPVCTGGCVTQWPARHLILAVVASSTEKQLANLNVSMKRKFDLAFQDESEVHFKELVSQGFKIPDRWSLSRGRINLDIACMALARDRHCSSTLTWRQLNFDTSPKGGLELLGLREYCIYNKDVAGASSRALPLQALGIAHATAVDKAAAVLHSIWLEAGPAEHSIRAYVASVSVVLTDAGVEQYVSELPDCISPFLSGNMESLELNEPSALFPRALRVLDWSHLWHWLAEHICESMSFYAEWEPLAKAVAKLLSTASYVDTLVKSLEEQHAPEGLRKQLRGFRGRFITWRFGSIQQVTKDLMAVKEALILAWGEGKFRFRDSVLLSRVGAAMRNPAFWAWTRVLEGFSQFTETHRQWGLGCHCHEAQCQEAARRHQTFACPRKSMRGPELHGHLSDAKLELPRMVAQLIQDPEVQAVHGLDVEAAACSNRLLALMDLKLGYVRKMPWLLWRIRDSPAAAQQALDQYDEACRRERQIHRLSHFFCSPQGGLRRHMQELTEIQTQESLRVCAAQGLICQTMTPRAVARGKVEAFFLGMG